jgi:hypothetical protein
MHVHQILTASLRYGCPRADNGAVLSGNTQNAIFGLDGDLPTQKGVEAIHGKSFPQILSGRSSTHFGSTRAPVDGSIFDALAGVYCLLLGSGVSRPSEIPTGWEITLDLVRRVAALRGVTDEPDWAVWYKATFGSEPKYSELLDQLASTPDERRSVLHSYIEPNADGIAAGRKTPTRAH